MYSWPVEFYGSFLELSLKSTSEDVASVRQAQGNATSSHDEGDCDREEDEGRDKDDYGKS